MSHGLTDKRVLITAGASGLGRAMAAAFLAAGARVHICDLDKTTLSACQETMRGLTTSQIDVAEHEAVERLFVDAEAALGGLDVLINNAGIAGPTALAEDCSPPDWSRTLEVNLNGAFFCARQAIPLLKLAGGGVILNMSSTAGLHGCPQRAPYVASKWALIGLTKTLAMELGSFGIRVNAICPGSVEGPRIERVIAADAASRDRTPEEIRMHYQSQTSLRCFVSAEDVAATALFLASPAGRRISGQAVSVDGHTESLSL
ncbi:MAG: SDR family oxidoreductase [Pseudomonadota bacterium]